MASSVIDSSIIEVLFEKNAFSIAKVDGFNDLAKSFIVASAKSALHAKSLTQYILQFYKKSSSFGAKVEGLQSGDWVVIDMGELMIHIFRQEVRDYYAVDDLWNPTPVKPTKITDTNNTSESKENSAS